MDWIHLAQDNDQWQAVMKEPSDFIQSRKFLH